MSLKSTCLKNVFDNESKIWPNTKENHCHSKFYHKSMNYIVTLSDAQTTTANMTYDA